MKMLDVQTHAEAKALNDAIFEKMKADHVKNGGIVENGAIIHVVGKQGTERWGDVKTSEDGKTFQVKDPDAKIKGMKDYLKSKGLSFKEKIRVKNL